MRPILIAVLALLLGPAAAAQVLQPVSQTRTVAAGCAAQDATTSPTDSDFAAAPGFGPFDETVSASVSTPMGDTATGAASQNSTIGGDSITATGSCSASAFLEGGISASASGSSNLSVTFDLAEFATYSLDGFVSSNNSGGTTQLTLAGPGGTVESFSTAGTQTVLIGAAGALDPGQYTYSIQSSASAANFAFSGGAYTVALQLVGETPSFCDDDDGSLASCPCAPGNPETGCEIQQGTGGVGLELLVQQTAPENRVTWQGSGFPVANTPTAIVIRATDLDPGAPVVFGDGLRCIGTPLVRLGAAFAVGGTSTHTHGHGGGAGTGDFFYQLWFRNTPTMYCTPAAFNLSNGRTLIW